MDTYLKRWFKNLAILVLSFAVILLIYGGVLVIDFLFRTNTYLGWTALVLLCVTIMTSSID